MGFLIKFLQAWSAHRAERQHANMGVQRRRIPLWLRWSIAGVIVAAVFRRAIAAIVVGTLSAGLHLVGVNLHLPHIPLQWPWQSIHQGTTTNTDLGPWVLQKIEGISRPALGQANFSFDFTHKVSKNIGPWPCWYQSTFHAVGRASATVDLNPGPSWWAPATGHYILQQTGKRVSIVMVLPAPQLPQSAHQVSIDNLPSKPIDTQHSWTYPGMGCGTILKPQFPESVLYAQAQEIAYWKSRNSPYVTGALIRAAEGEAVQMIRNNFIQPTVNALGYKLVSFSIRWV